MNKADVFFLICTLHVIGDFYFQVDFLTDDKEKSWLSFLRHILIYTMPFALFSLYEVLCHDNCVFLFISLWCFIIHAIIDFVKIIVVRLLDNKDECTYFPAIIFAIDQLLHVLILWIVASAFDYYIPSLSSLIQFLLPYVLYFLCLMKPANVTFKIIFSSLRIKAHENDVDNQEPGAGACIGNLERVLSGIFIILNQFSAAGLTMTAKSVARFNQISTDKNFAEY